VIDLRPLGDRAFLARFDDVDAARGWASTARSRGWPGVDVVLAYATVAVHAEPDRVDLDDLEAGLRGLDFGPSTAPEASSFELPVLYDGEDLGPVASALNMAVDPLIRLHSSMVYEVQAVGFLPGFPYLGDLPAPLRGLARREVPRAAVPAGSVAIVGRQSCVYPASSPGGWHLIGRTPLRIVDVDSGYFPIRAGDQVRFRPIDFEEYQARSGERLSPIEAIG